jgi:very-short-patch-repair endonuclease
MLNNPFNPRTYARQLRQNATESEKILWPYLRNRQFYGYKITRQYVFNYINNEKESHFFIFDFYCSAAKLAIEIDGSSHNTKQGDDFLRDETTALYGIRTLRIKNETVFNDLSTALANILEFLKASI